MSPGNEATSGGIDDQRVGGEDVEAKEGGDWEVWDNEELVRTVKGAQEEAQSDGRRDQDLGAVSKA